MRVIVHGGAGADPDDPDERRAVLEEAAARGAEARSPVEAVEEAVRRLEASPRFNAGVGGAVQSDGAVRADAGIMTGERDAGAVCAAPGVGHAVSAARAVMEETPHVLLAGEHAAALADAFGVDTGEDLLTDRTRDRWSDLDPPQGGLEEQLAWVRERFGRSGDRDHDTVGAVAADGGAVAAATSTGGRWCALAGRVGDTPQIGSGFYASPAGGASATGDGEEIAKATLARRAVRGLEAGDGAEAAAERAVGEFGELTGAHAGVILMGRDGDAGRAFNSEGLQTAVARR